MFHLGLPNIMEESKIRLVCAWIGEGEGCSHSPVLGKSYCKKHHERVYDTFLPEMADYILDKEVNSDLSNTI